MKKEQYLQRLRKGYAEEELVRDVWNEQLQEIKEHIQDEKKELGIYKGKQGNKGGRPLCLLTKDQSD